MRIVRLIASLLHLGSGGGMSVLKIAWRSIQHRGFGSFLTVLSMALGVMMVVAVLTIHGVVEKSFKNNNSFGYNVIVGARGGSMQLTMNTVYYLSKPVENIPYEYYLAFCDKETRQREIKSSIAYTAIEHEIESAFSDNPIPGGGIGSAIVTDINRSTFLAGQESRLRLNRDGIFKPYTHMAIPICLGDYWEVPDTDLNFRCVGTKPEFFTELVIDLDSEEHFEFAEGRCFLDWNTDDPTIGPHECVVGALVGKRGNVKLGDQIMPTHGDPNSAGSHIHETPFTVVGIMAPTGTPHDRVVFLNMEGFFLMEGHVKPVEDDGMLKVNVNAEEEDDVPDFDEEGSLNDDGEIEDLEPIDDDEQRRLDDEAVARIREGLSGAAPDETRPEGEMSDEARSALNQERLAIERREVTALLVRTSLRDEAGTLGMFLPILINRGDLETTLDWTPYRPIKAQTSAQGVNPVGEVNNLFALFVDPTKWILLALTIMICIVSAISILVGIYNSMSQRKHEIAVMRALGASRTNVMSIMFVESVMLALMGGLLGWVAGHGLNACLGPTIEARTGVPLGFFDFAPAQPLGTYFGSIANDLPSFLTALPVSPEMLLIPGLMILAVIVGIYPAFSAYKTDVASSLGK